MTFRHTVATHNPMPKIGKHRLFLETNVSLHAVHDPVPKIGKHCLFYKKKCLPRHTLVTPYITQCPKSESTVYFTKKMFTLLTLITLLCTLPSKRLSPAAFITLLHALLSMHNHLITSAASLCLQTQVVAPTQSTS